MGVTYFTPLPITATLYWPYNIYLYKYELRCRHHLCIVLSRYISLYSAFYSVNDAEMSQQWFFFISPAPHNRLPNRVLWPNYVIFDNVRDHCRNNIFLYIIRSGVFPTLCTRLRYLCFYRVIHTSYTFIFCTLWLLTLIHLFPYRNIMFTVKSFGTADGRYKKTLSLSHTHTQYILYVVIVPFHLLGISKKTLKPRIFILCSATW